MLADREKRTATIARFEQALGIPSCCSAMNQFGSKVSLIEQEIRIPAIERAEDLVPDSLILIIRQIESVSSHPRRSVLITEPRSHLSSNRAPSQRMIGQGSDQLILLEEPPPRAQADSAESTPFGDLLVLVRDEPEQYRLSLAAQMVLYRRLPAQEQQAMVDVALSRDERFLRHAQHHCGGALEIAPSTMESQLSGRRSPPEIGVIRETLGQGQQFQVQLRPLLSNDCESG
jgi:hypothetical protein